MNSQLSGTAAVLCAALVLSACATSYYHRYGPPPGAYAPGPQAYGPPPPYEDRARWQRPRAYVPDMYPDRPYMDQAERGLRSSLPGRLAVQRQGPRLSFDMLGDVLFELDSARLRPEARALIGSVAAELVRYRFTLVDVNGFTDTSGTLEHNQQLSEDRANAVADELARDGVDPRRIRAQGYGENGLAVPTPDGVREARNRRVEIVLLPPRRPPGFPMP
jgi:outer membrane protein OmpA-like peptidoglycan-associated protein